MNIEEAKRIDLRCFMKQLGHTPVKREYGKEWYMSPFRMELKASFKVNIYKNLWFDFGMGTGGDIILLCKLLYKVEDVSQVLKMIEERTPPDSGMEMTKENSGRREQMDSAIRNMRMGELKHGALLSYMMSRRIDIELAKRFCVEVHYDHLHSHYFGIGFRNDAGGVELRNPYFKGCYGCKEVTVIRTCEGVAVCHVFEGFMDFLAYLTLQKHGAKGYEGNEPADYVVLNSVSNLKRAVAVLEEYKKIDCYMDNDRAGQLATQWLEGVLPGRVVNRSVLYKGFKDVNDRLMELPMEKK